MIHYYKHLAIGSIFAASLILTIFISNSANKNPSQSLKTSAQVDQSQPLVTDTIVNNIHRGTCNFVCKQIGKYCAAGGVTNGWSWDYWDYESGKCVKKSLKLPTDQTGCSKGLTTDRNEMCYAKEAQWTKCACR